MAEAVLEVVAVLLEDIEGLVLDLPAGAGAVWRSGRRGTEHPVIVLRAAVAELASRAVRAVDGARSE